jgi:hypothetical protein
VGKGSMSGDAEERDQSAETISGLEKLRHTVRDYIKPEDFDRLIAAESPVADEPVVRDA